MLRVRGLRKSFGPVLAVRNVSFTLERGRITALVGENGAGKTTTLRMIVGLLERDAGTVEIDASRVGYIPENPAYFSWLSGASVLDLTARAFGFSPGNLRTEVPRLCGKIGFATELLRRRPATYSAGNLRKFAYLQNLAVRPDLLVVDESFAALDPPSIKRLREIFAELREKGTTILVSSHILAELDKIADDFIVMRKGEVVARSGLSRFRPGGAQTSAHDLETAFMELAQTEPK